MDIKEIAELTKRFNVLYVEDEEILREKSCMILESLFSSVGQAGDGKEGLEAYERFIKENGRPYDIVLTDINMPNMDGLEMSRKILDITPEQFITVVTAYNDPSNLQKIIDLGIGSFLHKPVEMLELLGELSKVALQIKERNDKAENERKIFELNKELEELNSNLGQIVEQRTKEVEHLLYYDKLTGLKTQGALLNDMKGVSFSVLFLINLDGFQTINKLYGFDAGDSILRQFGEFLEKYNRYKSYELYHIYGDIFVVYEGDNFAPIEEYERDLRLLKESLQTYDFYLSDFDEYIEMDATIGVSLGQENPLATADMALSYAKEHKLGFMVYNSTLDRTKEFKDTLMWKKRIKNAIEGDRVYPVFHPIYGTDGEIKKYEVLMRISEFVNGEERVYYPGDFLRSAINTKQYNDLSKVIIDKSFEQMSENNTAFSINISFEDIYNNTLINTIKKNLNKYPALKDKLIIEILETEAIYDSKIMKEFIKTFRTYGVKIAIDDFGTGHSNLFNIMEIEPDYIKIDGSFIKNIDKDKTSLAMVKAISDFAKDLGIKTIAEFVHSGEIYEIVKGLGIDEFQGFYFSKELKSI